MTLLGCHEVEPFEQPVERIPPDGVGDVTPERALERVRLEQASVEEWDGAEEAGGAAAFCRWAVERAEEQRPEQVAMDPPLA